MNQHIEKNYWLFLPRINHPGDEEIMRKKYKLTIEVAYGQNGVPDSELIRLLQNIPSRIMDDGMFTGETNAEVIEWSSEVREIS